MNIKWAKRLKLKQLKLLILLAENGNLSETARQANMTQPALSRWLKELEEDTGHELFARHARGLTPTAAGNILIAHARRILIEAERTQQDLDDTARGDSRTLLIGMSPAAAPHFVPTAAMRFLQANPKVYLEIQEGTMDHLVGRLKQGLLDLVVGRLDNYEPDSELQSEQLYLDPIRIVARMHHPLTQKSALKWADLEPYEWIIWPSGTPIRSRLDNALTAAGRRAPVYRIQSTSQVANLWLLQYSDMLSVASKGVAEHFHRRGLLTELNLPLDTADGAVGMVWREQAQPDTLLHQFIGCCRTAVRTIGADAGPLSFQAV
ncbi:LysR substrate-binding domain-containing protein [Neisseria leonii]|uniref:LysR family transcriptional regulator n=1 Tax=Neisseria leonii TaxID=2995413 RepID=A0A9X4IER1_9NEIS|nr:LysR substrate-binding domain-containing protein [Neisseria sp. 51.81]MDD9328467.1 LysR family transcriptional regulator [Neisseria sp. 51.81]